MSADLRYVPQVKDLKDVVYVSDDKELMVKIIDRLIPNEENKT